MSSDVQHLRETAEILQSWADETRTASQQRELESMAFDLELLANTKEALREEGIDGGERVAEL